MNRKHGDREFGSNKHYPEDDRCAYCETLGCIPRNCAWWMELVDPEDLTRNRKGASRATFKYKKKKRETSRPKSKGPASSDRTTDAATGSPDASRKPPLPRKARDDESTSHHSSTLGKSRSSGGTEQTDIAKAPDEN